MDDLKKIKESFPDIHAEIFMSAYIRHKAATKLKMETVRKIQQLLGFQP